MKVIHYAGEELLTGTRIADAMLEYAQTLAKNDSADTVDIPVITADGRTLHTSCLLGPASQLIAVEAPDYSGDELEDDALVERLSGLARRLTNPVGLPLASEPVDFESYEP